MAYIIFSKPRQEFRALENLERQGYRAFLPLCRRTPQSEVSPLFPRYLFFWVDDKPWGPIKNTLGVSTILKQSDFQPSQVSETVIESIRTRMNCDGGAVILEYGTPERVFKKGQRIQVVGGTHAGMSGLYVSKTKDRIVALFNMFGRQIKATVKEANIA